MRNTRMRTIGISCVAALWLLLTAACWLGKSNDISEAERRKLAQFPKVSADTLLSGKFMSGFESFTQDQFPLRDRFRQLKAEFSYGVLRKGDNNGIYLAEGCAARLEYPLNKTSVSGAVKKFQKIHDLYLRDNSGKIVFSIAPDKSYYLAEKNGYPAMEYEALFSAFRDLEWAEYADLTDCLDESCYYRTDTHWRQEKLLPAAERIADALGTEIETEYTLCPVERPFYGVYYGQAALPMEPDTMYYLENETLKNCAVYNYETKTESAVINLQKLGSRDLYDIFLSGAVSVLDIENTNNQSGKELVVFRDSFGSSLVPLLLSGYSKVTVVDIRYVPTDYLSQFVDFHGQDVLFLYSPLVLNQSTMLK